MVLKHSLIEYSIAVLFFFQYDLGFIQEIVIALVGLQALKTIKQRELVLEQGKNSYYNRRFKREFKKKIELYREKGEEVHASPPIGVEGSSYVVIEYYAINSDKVSLKEIGEFKDSIVGKPPMISEGLLVIGKAEGKLIKDREKLNKVLKSYKLWRFLYFNPPFQNSEIAYHRYLLSLSYIANSAILSRSRRALSELSESDLEGLVNVNRTLVILSEVRKRRFSQEKWIADNIFSLLSSPTYDELSELVDRLSFNIELVNEESYLIKRKSSELEVISEEFRSKLGSIEDPRWRKVLAAIVFESVIAKLGVANTNYVTSLWEFTSEASKSAKKRISSLLIDIVLIEGVLDKLGKEDRKLNQEYIKMAEEAKTHWEDPNIKMVRSLS